MNLSEYYLEENYIHYSNCHEDYLLLDKYIKSNTKEVLSVASALDNSLSFLVHKNVKVHAFDFNPSQVKLGKLKICAIKDLTYKNFLVFIGINEGDRIALYNKIKKHLEDDVKEYFDSHLFLIEKGLVNIGRFEQYFHLFRKKVFPLVCRSKYIKEFALCETLEQQQEIYEKKINTFRFRLMFKIFFSKTLMAKLGRDKEFFKYSHDNLPRILKNRIDSGFMNVLNKTNPYYGYVLNAGYKELPFYLQKENFTKIKANIQNIQVEEKSFDQMLEHNYDFMNLSDIFEYMDNSKMPYYSDLIAQHLNKDGIVAFWNMMNVRSLSSLKRISGKNEYLKDRAFFYRDFLVYEK
ncbi:MAG: DUF3419 family protein [Treponema sp.]|nr:DUF3419 family protein [Treponema sp.]